VSFLRRARLIEPQELSPDVEGRLLAAPIGSAPGAKGSPIRFVQFSGAMFFGSAGELRDALDGLADDPGTRVLILRLKHTQRLDYSSAEVIASLSRRMKERDQTLLMAGMDASALNTLKKSGVVAELGDNQLFLSDAGFFRAAALAVEHATTLVEAPEDPLVRWAKRELARGDGRGVQELVP
ncbi:MAG: sodium-independent anion transporter, partial [Myxococcota bacterium]